MEEFLKRNMWNMDVEGFISYNQSDLSGDQDDS